MDYLECSVIGNNLAVAEMLAGKRRAALDTFKIALETLCEGVAYCTPTVTADAPYRGFNIFQQTSASNMSPFLPVSSHGDIPLSPSDTPAFTFTKAFVFNPSVQISEDHVDSYKAVILFNLALLYDSQEKNMQDDRFEATALELYNCSLELSLDPAQSASLPLDCSNLVIATLNNKTQIFFRRNEVESTRASLEELRKNLGKALEEGTKALDDQDINGLLLNVHCQSALICAPGA